MFKVISLQETDEPNIFMDVEGNAYSTKRNSIYKMKKCKHSMGYECLMIWENGKSKCVLIHRLMGNAYLGLDLKNSKLQMNHINKCKTDNRLCNLEIVTNRQNRLHSLGYADYKAM